MASDAGDVEDPLLVDPVELSQVTGLAPCQLQGNTQSRKRRPQFV